MLIGHPPGAAGRFAEGVWPLPGRNIRCCGYSVIDHLNPQVFEFDRWSPFSSIR